MSVANGSVGAPKIGNTNNDFRRISPSKYWFFTWNNYEEKDIEKILSLVPTFESYAFQEEVGKCGTPHLQGFIKFREKVRPKSVFHFTDKIHWEKPRNVNACKNYCLKNETRAGRQFTNIPIPDVYLGPNIELYEWQKEIVNMLQSPVNDRIINWFWDTKGGVGKTTFCKWICCNFNDVIIVGGCNKDMLNGVNQYYLKSQKFPKIVIINVPRAKLNKVSYSGIEQVKDMFFFSPKYEGGMINGPSPHLLVFANDLPEFNKLSDDRWNVRKIENSYIVQNDIII